MNRKSFILNIATGLLLVNGVFASDPKTEEDRMVLNSINYIDEDSDFELGFDTADYLPEGFDPYEIFVDLNAVIFLEEEALNDFDTKKYLPADFNAYAFPTNVESMHYIDENDRVELDFDTHEHLPEGFDPYSRNTK
ncbi:MAG TPA: hypothetical protein VFM69_08985 [Pricia sp.]|nr:hypothetical protein [Pricia sp.]